MNVGQLLPRIVSWLSTDYSLADESGFSPLRGKGASRWTAPMRVMNQKRDRLIGEGGQVRDHMSWRINSRRAMHWRWRVLRRSRDEYFQEII